MRVLFSPSSPPNYPSDDVLLLCFAPLEVLSRINRFVLFYFFVIFIVIIGTATIIYLISLFSSSNGDNICYYGCCVIYHSSQFASSVLS